MTVYGTPAKNALLATILVGAVACSFEFPGSSKHVHTETVMGTCTIDDGCYDLNRSAYTQAAGVLLSAPRR